MQPEVTPMLSNTDISFISHTCYSKALLLNTTCNKLSESTSIFLGSISFKRKPR